MQGLHDPAVLVRREIRLAVALPFPDDGVELRLLGHAVTRQHRGHPREKLAGPFAVRVGGSPAEGGQLHHHGLHLPMLLDQDIGHVTLVVGHWHSSGCRERDTGAQVTSSAGWAGTAPR
jgi:hypothetical protein